jgi:glycolate oxidase FAD binding subunit
VSADGTSGAATLPSGDPADEHRGIASDAVDGVVPAAVLRPATLDDARALVRRTAERDHALVARGRGRHVAIGEVPTRLDVLLSLERLDRVREHHAADMTITVEAGCTLAALERTLAAAEQWLPLDPPAPDETTVGGLIAANLSGPLRASHGTVRDCLLGLSWIGPGGELVSAGGRVVKNVAGYDVAKAHVGALGTLGVLAEATLKVRPRPPCERALVLACDDAHAAVELALAARDAVEPAWLEVASPGVLADAGGSFAVVAGWLGLAEEVADAERRVRALAGDQHAPVVSAVDAADARALRARLARFALEPAAAVLRAATLPSALGELLTAVGPCGGQDEGPRCVGHAANGIARIAVRHAADVAPLVAALRSRLLAGGGSLVVERAAPDVKQALAALGGVFGDPGPGRALMRRLKEALDPRRTFAPGRFVAGI